VWVAVLGAALVLFTAAMVPLSLLSEQPFNGAVALVIGVPCAAVGLIVARSQPGNPLGWLLATMGGCFILTGSSVLVVAVSTLVVAALFSPLRRRVQRLVDRRFNRARYDADRTVALFAGRLRGSVDLDAARGDLADVVGRALEPAHLSVWIAGGRP
jgi:hypothetical protein